MSENLFDLMAKVGLHELSASVLNMLNIPVNRIIHSHTDETWVVPNLLPEFDGETLTIRYQPINKDDLAPDAEYFIREDRRYKLVIDWPT